MTLHFTQHNVRIGNSFYRSEVLGAFALVACTGRDTRGTFSHLEPRQFKTSKEFTDAVAARKTAYPTGGSVIDGVALHAVFRRTFSLLPSGWFFPDSDAARSALLTFLEAMAQAAQRAGQPDRAAQWRSGEVERAMLATSQSRDTLQRAARQSGCIMGPDHDLKALALSVDWKAAKERLADLKAGTTKARPREGDAT